MGRDRHPDAVSAPDAVAARLSTLDRFLPVWIGRRWPLAYCWADSFPAWIGAECRSGRRDFAADRGGPAGDDVSGAGQGPLRPAGQVTADRKLMVPSLLLNWVLGPALMFTLAWLLLADLPAYRTGLIIVGLARCIAMVIIWNDLACGDREAAAVLVALNSLFQVLMFACWAGSTCRCCPAGWPAPNRHRRLPVADRQIGAHLPRRPAAGRIPVAPTGERAKGRHWYETGSCPASGRGPVRVAVHHRDPVRHARPPITSRPWDVARIAFPLLAYFAIMWAGGYALGFGLRLGYARTTTLAFTAAGNNFELAIAVAIATFGVTSGQALAGVVGPLIEVPVLVGLVYVSLALRTRLFRGRARRRSPC